MNNRFSFDSTNGFTVRAEDNIPIANFHPEAVSIIKYIDGTNVTIKVVVNFYGEEFICQAEIELKGLEKFDYSALDSELILFPEIHTAGRDMAKIIKRQAENVHSKEIIQLNILCLTYATTRAATCNPSERCFLTCSTKAIWF